MSRGIGNYDIHQDPGDSNQGNRQQTLEVFRDFRVESVINHKGFLQEDKSESVIRILSVNVNRLKPNQREKMEQFKEFVIKNKVDIALLMETNAKWTTDIIDQISYQLKEFRRNTMAIFRDSKSYNTINSNWLQGGLMNVLTGRIVSCYDKQSVYVDELGKWAAF
jgi:hypothetical protein